MNSDIGMGKDWGSKRGLNENRAVPEERGQWTVDRGQRTEDRGHWTEERA